MSNSFDRPSRMVAFLLSLAVAGVALFPSCTSPLGAADYRDDPNTDAIVAKTIIDASFRGQTAHEPTVSAGVRELTLADGVTGPAAPSSSAVTPVDVAAASSPAAAPAAAPADTRPSPTTQPNAIGLDAARLRQEEPVFNLSLQDAIARACKNSLAIRVEAYNPSIRESQITQAEAAFDPIFFGQLNYALSDQPAYITGTGNNGHTIQGQAGIKQLLPSGATAQLAATSTYRYLNPNDPNNSLFVPFHTSYTTNLNATITQPLARGFGAGITEASIYVSQADRRIALATFRRQVITTVADVENAYLNLVLARTLVDIQERLLLATEITYQRVKARDQIDADKIAVSQAVAAVMARRAEVIRARTALRNQSDTLKVLLNDPELNISQNTLINPTDRPNAELAVTSTAEAIETALRQRTELQEARLQIERANIVITVAKNDLLPKVDLTVGVQTNGLDNSFDSAFNSTVHSDYIEFNAGVRIEFPIGNRRAEAELVQHKHERAQALTQMAAIAQRVVQDVKQQLRETLSAHAEIQARERARMSAAEELLAITQKETIVELRPEFLQLKLDSQNRLALAEQNLIQSLVNYNISVMRLEQAKGTLLEYNRISLDRAPVARYQDDIGKIRFMGQTYMIK